VENRAKIFTNGRSQAVRLPQSCRFPPGVRSVQARKVGHAVILEPIEGVAWDPAYWAALEAMPPLDEADGTMDLGASQSGGL
jgi:virulence-associated protein VagC